MTAPSCPAGSMMTQMSYLRSAGPWRSERATAAERRPEAERILAPYLPASAARGGRVMVERGQQDSDQGTRTAGLATRRAVRVDAFAPAAVAEAGQRRDLYSSGVAEFTANVKPFASWAELWAQDNAGPTADADASPSAWPGKRCEESPATGPPACSLTPPRAPPRSCSPSRHPRLSRAQFAQWVRTSHRYISREALTEIVQHAAASPDLHNLALESRRNHRRPDRGRATTARTSGSGTSSGCPARSVACPRMSHAILPAGRRSRRACRRRCPRAVGCAAEDQPRREPERLAGS